MAYKILQGDNRQTLKTLADNSIDAIVTDPPYGIDFLGKAWDANTGALETYQECLRVLKPGGHILAFSAARTYHHLAITLEQAGFEIRDQIMWLYSSGFPKSQDIGRSIQRSMGVKETKKVKDDGSKAKHYDYGMKESKENDMVVVTDPEAKVWEGWGTSLKPAHEPIALARKPIKQSIANNCQEWGTGALNIDATRVPFEDEKTKEQYANRPPNPRKTLMGSFANKAGQEVEDKYIEPAISEIGRFPSNVLGEIPDYQKYFYCPKVSRAERHIGFDTANIPQIGSTHPDDVKKHPLWDPSIGGDAARLKQKIIDAGQYSGNNHPTVKPVQLMKYLINLITPPNGIVLDPFNGSGSTGMAATELGFEYIGCELDPAYVEITKKRIDAWLVRDLADNNFDSLFEEAK